MWQILRGMEQLWCTQKPQSLQLCYFLKKEDVADLGLSQQQLWPHKQNTQKNFESAYISIKNMQIH